MRHGSSCNPCPGDSAHQTSSTPRPKTWASTTAQPAQSPLYPTHLPSARNAIRSRPKPALRCCHRPQCGKPRTPLRGSRLSSLGAAMIFKGLRRGSWQMASARGGASRMNPSRSVGGACGAGRGMSDSIGGALYARQAGQCCVGTPGHRHVQSKEQSLATPLLHASLFAAPSLTLHHVLGVDEAEAIHPFLHTHTNKQAHATVSVSACTASARARTACHG